tara:strand:+ start:759 stop:2510 length:1752 start_codon:yes stop_codon:yes gene_type:complete
MDSSNQLLNVIHNDQLTIREEIQSSNVRLDDVVDVLKNQFEFTKDIANMESRQSETEELQQIEQQAEEGRSLGEKASAGMGKVGAAGSSFFSNMGKGILGGLRMPSFSSLLRGGLLAAIGYKFGDEIGEFLATELEFIMDTAGFDEDITEAFKNQVAEYTGPVLMGAGIGLLFGPGGALIGAIAGYLFKWLGFDELYKDLKAASSDEEKKKLWSEFGDKVIGQLIDNPVPALLLAGSLFGVKGIIVAGVAGVLYEALGLDRLFTEGGFKAFSSDIFTAVMNKVTGNRFGGGGNDEFVGPPEPAPARTSFTDAVRNTFTLSGKTKTRFSSGTDELSPMIAAPNTFIEDQAVEGGQFFLRKAILDAENARRGVTSRFGIPTLNELGRRAPVAPVASEAAETGAERILREFGEEGLDRIIVDSTGTAAKETTEQLLESGGKELLGEVAEKAAITGVKTLLKKIPFGVGFVISLPLAAGRVIKGDFLGAGLELAEGLSAAVPGVGTAASIGTAGALLAHDISMIAPAVLENQVSDQTRNLVESGTNVTVGGSTVIDNSTTNISGPAGGSQGNIASGGVTSEYLKARP